MFRCLPNWLDRRVHVGERCFMERMWHSCTRRMRGRVGVETVGVEAPVCVQMGISGTSRVGEPDDAGVNFQCDCLRVYLLSAGGEDSLGWWW